MATGKTRSTRKLRNWVVEQLESGKFPGVCWEDAQKTMFRIPWKHAGKQDFREDQDAAFFKAWATFKGKHKEGDTEGPAVWKTRLRCALNKSSEFEEVPQRSQLDGAEPYKVYRLLPQGILPIRPETQKSPVKRHHSSVSPDREDEQSDMKRCTLSLPPSHEHLINELEVDGISSCPDTRNSSSSPCDSEPQKGTDLSNDLLQGAQCSIDLLLPLDSEPQADQEATETALWNTIMPQDFSLLLTFIYDGHVVGSAQVKSLDCRLVAEPHSSQGIIEQVFFPKPDPLEPTQSLLNQLKRGVLVASNCRGLSVRNLCPIPVSWNSPQAPVGPGPHILPSNKEVELFKTTDFCKDWDLYRQGMGPPPKFQVTLDFWEKRPDPSHSSQSLITVKMEQAFAQRMLRNVELEEQLTAIVP